MYLVLIKVVHLYFLVKLDVCSSCVGADDGIVMTLVHWHEVCLIVLEDELGGGGHDDNDG